VLAQNERVRKTESHSITQNAARDSK